MKKIISYLLILVIAAQMLATVAFAATSTKYTAALTFQGEHTGPVREYTGTTMHWYGTTYEEDRHPESPTTFTVYLYKKGFWSSPLVGEARQCIRSAYNSEWWYNIGSGKYFFSYVKARDGATVNSDCITMEMTP